MNQFTLVKALQITAILEGISYLFFAITMPLKYMYDMPQPNYIVGMAHGVLFIAYNLLVLVVWYHYKWSFKKALLCGLASLLPFATFWVERKMLRPLSVKN